MKKSKSSPETVDDLRTEYVFDFSKAKPNPYAARLKGRAVAVVLEPDVAAVFPTSQSVNRLLRSVVAAVPHRARVSGKTRKARGRTRG
jgi:hypothetical protein